MNEVFILVINMRFVNIRFILLVFLFCAPSVSLMLFAQANEEIKIDNLEIDPTGQIAPLEKENSFVAFFKQTRISGGFSFAHSLGAFALFVPISLGANINWDFTLNRGKTAIWRSTYSFEQVGIGELSNLFSLEIHAFLFGPSYSYSKGWNSFYMAILPGVSVYLFKKGPLGSGSDVTFTLKGIIGYELNLDKLTKKPGIFLFLHAITTYLFDTENLYLNVGFQVGVGYNFGKSYRKLL